MDSKEFDAMWNSPEMVEFGKEAISRFKQARSKLEARETAKTMIWEQQMELLASMLNQLPRNRRRAFVKKLRLDFEDKFNEMYPLEKFKKSQD